MTSMKSLTEETCVACRADAPKVSSEEASTLLADLESWTIAEEEIPFLTKTYRFSNFVKALAFTNAVGELAEQEDHHPRLVTEWGRVTVDWWTHKIKGLHRNDFVCAAKTEELFTAE